MRERSIQPLLFFMSQALSDRQCPRIQPRSFIAVTHAPAIGFNKFEFYLAATICISLPPNGEKMAVTIYKLENSKEAG